MTLTSDAPITDSPITMNPLSLWTFYRRHKGRAGLFISLAGLATMGLYLMGILIPATFVEPGRYAHTYLDRMSLVFPEGQPELDSEIIEQIRVHPHVAEVLSLYSLPIDLPNPTVGESRLPLFGVRAGDIETVVRRAGVVLKEGNFVQPHSNGIMLSEELAATLGVEVGDPLSREVHHDRYWDLVDPLQVVGVLKGDVRIAIISHEYVSDHHLYQHRATKGVIVLAQQGYKQIVNEFLLTQVQSNRTQTRTLPQLTERIDAEFTSGLIYLIPVEVLVAIIITVVIGIINQIAFDRRLPEFGVLNAMGHSRRWLIRHVATETALLTGLGWLLGLGLALLVLIVLRTLYFTPKGYELPLFSPWAIYLTCPLPIMVIGHVTLNLTRLSGRLDSVAMVEQRDLKVSSNDIKLSGQGTITRNALGAGPLRPLTSLAFFSRHRQRATLLISAMSFMITAIVILVFIFSLSSIGLHLERGDRRLVNVVYPLSSPTVQPDVIHQIKTHPAVSRTIHGIQFQPMRVSIPPFASYGVRTYALMADDMRYLIDFYDLRLKEGALPRPQSNEMVISEIMALNRSLQVGDVIGHREQPIYDGAPVLPTEFVVSGVFARATAYEEQNLLAFVSQEFILKQEPFVNGTYGANNLIVVPNAGQKTELDDWMESAWSTEQVGIATYRLDAARAEQEVRTMIMAIALIESLVALVAALALAVLNYIFFMQRQSEFGVLYALGHSRLQLVWRTVRETLFVTGTAWALSLFFCLVGLIYLKFGLFARLGLTLNMSNPTPWLFTLPIPLAVFAASIGTIVWMLLRLDPVSIIERR